MSLLDDLDELDLAENPARLPVTPPLCVTPAPQPGAAVAAGTAAHMNTDTVPEVHAGSEETAQNSGHDTLVEASAAPVAALAEPCSLEALGTPTAGASASQEHSVSKPQQGELFESPAPTTVATKILLNAADILGFEEPKKKKAKGSGKTKAREAAILKAKTLYLNDVTENKVALPAIFDGPENTAKALELLQVSQEVSLDLETTALTKWTIEAPAPVSSKLGTGETMSKYAKRQGRLLWVAAHEGLDVGSLPEDPDALGLDEDTWLQYAKTDAIVPDPTPRARIISLGIFPPGDSEHAEQFAFDVDLFKTPQDKALLHDLVHALHGKCWYGHNLSFDLGWLRHYDAEVMPAALVDTFLLTLTVAPHFEAILVDRMLTIGEVLTTNDDGEVVEYFNKRAHVYSPEYRRDDDLPQRWESKFVDTLRQGTASRATINKIMIERQAAQFRADSGEASRGLPLALLSAALLGDVLDKAYQKPHNWMPPVLSQGHYAYCLGDITQPPKIARLLLGLSEHASLQELLAKLGRDATMQPAPEHSEIARNATPGYQAWDDACAATDILVRMQHKGLYINEAQTHEYIAKHRDAAAQDWEKVLEIAPSLAPFGDDYLERLGQSAAYKATLVKAFQALAPGVEHPKTGSGTDALGAKEILAAYKDTPGEQLNTALVKVSGSVKRANMAQAYLSLAKTCEHNRLHSIVGIATMTMRTASQEPNLQNAPNAKDFRALFTGENEHRRIIAGDFSAVEMRVAAALAERSWAQFRHLIDLARAAQDASNFEALRTQEAYLSAVRTQYGEFVLSILGEPSRDPSRRKHFISKILRAVKSGTIPEDWPDGGADVLIERPAFGSSTADDWAQYYGQVLARVLRKMHRRGALRPESSQDVLTLSDVFRRDVDVHLATALSLAPGDVDTKGLSPVEFLASLPKQEADDLKQKLKKPRQSAKACNFGLLYGMQGAKLHKYGIVTYGLSWEVEEAEVARDIWFDLYPELELWHFLTRMRKSKVNVGDVIRRDSETVELGVRGNRLSKLFRASTLSGRPVCATQMPAVLNYQDQGSAAEMAFRTLRRLKEENLAKDLVAFVHDEFVLEVDADVAEEVRAKLHTILCEVGTEMLEPFGGIRVDAEVAMGNYWIH